MFDWLNAHSSALQVVANFGMLAVWLFYAQLLLSSLRRERRSRLLINQGKGEDAEAEILVANMSRESVFVEMLLAVLATDRGEVCTRPITDVNLHQDDDPSLRTYRTTSQGPLHSGGYMRLGTFGRIAQWVSRSDGKAPRWHSLEIRVIFFYGSEDTPLAALRSFGVLDGDDGRRSVHPYSTDTSTLRSRRHRGKIRRWLREHQ